MGHRRSMNALNGGFLLSLSPAIFPQKTKNLLHIFNLISFDAYYMKKCNETQATCQFLFEKQAKMLIPWKATAHNISRQQTKEFLSKAQLLFLYWKKLAIQYHKQRLFLPAEIRIVNRGKIWLCFLQFSNNHKSKISRRQILTFVLAKQRQNSKTKTNEKIS